MSNDTFCVFPFFNLNTNTNGSVKLCCNIRQNIHIKDDDDREFNLGTDDIDKVWASKYMNSVRDRMLLGEEINECRGCYDHERLTGSSSRTTTNQFYENDSEIISRVNQYRNHRKIHPVSSLEIRLGNTCNLSCNTCWGYSSSKSNEERISFLKKPVMNKELIQTFTDELHLPNDLNKWFRTESYQQNMMKSAKNLKRLYMTGGEPTLIKENSTFLQYLIDCGNTDCHVSFTTNGMTSDSNLLGLLKHFPNCEIQISCDATEEQAHYVRYPAVWSEFVKNVESMASLENVHLVFYTVVSAYNLYSLPNILGFIEPIARRRQAWWVPIFLDHAEYLHTHIWPREARLEALKQLQDSLVNTPSIVNHCELALNRVTNFYSSKEVHSERLQTFIDYNNVLDQSRGTSFNETFPNLIPYISI